MAIAKNDDRLKRKGSSLMSTDVIRDDLIGILLLSHGTLAQGMYSAAKMILGEQENVSVLCFEETEDPEDFGDRISEEIQKYPAGALVLCDLMGGTPFNQLLLKNDPDSYKAITGMNLGMVLEVLTSRDDGSIESLADTAAEAGKAGVVDAIELLKSKNKKRG